MKRDPLMVAGAVGGVVAAIASLWNAYQYSRLAGMVQQLSDTLLAHINAPGLHRDVAIASTKAELARDIGSMRHYELMEAS